MIKGWIEDVFLNILLSFKAHPFNTNRFVTLPLWSNIAMAWNVSNKITLHLFLCMSTEGKIWLVFEYMSLGDLAHLLRSSAGVSHTSTISFQEVRLFLKSMSYFAVYQTCMWMAIVNLSKKKKTNDEHIWWLFTIFLLPLITTNNRQIWCRLLVKLHPEWPTSRLKGIFTGIWLVATAWWTNFPREAPSVVVLESSSSRFPTLAWAEMFTLPIITGQVTAALSAVFHHFIKCYAITDEW